MLAEEQNINFIGKIPIEPALTLSCDYSSNDFVQNFNSSTTIQPIIQFITNVIQ